MRKETLLSENNTTESKLPCAWCLKDRNEPAKEGDSHGMCMDHLAIMMDKIAMRRAEKGR